MNGEVVEKFVYHGRVCIIVQIASLNDIYCNGYIRVAEDSEHVDKNYRESGAMEGADVTYEKYLGSTKADELTYCGTLQQYEDVPEGYYLGFDSAHYWNEENPESKMQHRVKERLKEMVRDFEIHNVFSEIKKEKYREEIEKVAENGK